MKKVTKAQKRALQEIQNPRRGYKPVMWQGYMAPDFKVEKLSDGWRCIIQLIKKGLVSATPGSYEDPSWEGYFFLSLTEEGLAAIQ